LDREIFLCSALFFQASLKYYLELWLVRLDCYADRKDVVQVLYYQCLGRYRIKDSWSFSYVSKDYPKNKCLPAMWCIELVVSLSVQSLFFSLRVIRSSHFSPSIFFANGWLLAAFINIDKILGWRYNRYTPRITRDTNYYPGKSFFTYIYLANHGC
jgi:hypothetical protein